MYVSVQEFLLDVAYCDPQDAQEKKVGEEGDDQVYKLYVGTDVYYCRPYHACDRPGPSITGRSGIIIT